MIAECAEASYLCPVCGYGGLLAPSRDYHICPAAARSSNWTILRFRTRNSELLGFPRGASGGLPARNRPKVGT